MCVCVFILLLWSNKWHLYEAQRNSNSLKHDKGMATKGLLEYNVLIDVSTYLQPQVPKYNIRSGEILTCMVFFMPVTQIRGNGRSQPRTRRTTCLDIVIRAATTTTTTPRRIRFLHGTLLALPCVTAYDLAGEMCWISFECSTVTTKTKTTTKKPQLPVFLHRCHQHYAYCPACTNYGPTPPPAALPGHDYNQPLLLQMPEPDPPQYPGPPLSSCQSTSPGLVQISAGGSGLVWQYEGQQSSLSGANLLTADEAPGRNINSNRNIYPKELSIRIISVWGQHTKIINQDFV